MDTQRFIQLGLFVSTFHRGSGAIILFFLAETFFTPWEIGLICLLGAVVGDLTIFKFVKNGFQLGEITDIYNHSIDAKHHLRKLFHSKYFSWTSLSGRGADHRFASPG